MVLSEKILYCRKKAGLSQEALAERLGVSRQAVSKWETGDAVPEINKLLLLSRAFGVSTDWLLSEDEPEEPQPEARYELPYDRAQERSASGMPGWIDSVPGLIGRLLRKYGWLFGVYTAISGLPFILIGALARSVSISMVSTFESAVASPFSGFGGGEIWYDAAGNVIDSPFAGSAGSFAANNPVAIVGGVMILIGLVLVIAGVVLAVILKKHSGDS